jgi:hypothetical protein
MLAHLSLQKRRGLLVAWSTNVAIISGFVASALTVLVVLAAYGRPSDGVWRIGFGVGIVVSRLREVTAEISFLLPSLLSVFV